jgi:hypothetical protein
VAARPVAFRISKEAPTLLSLTEDGERSAFPSGLEPSGCTRWEMVQFARAAPMPRADIRITDSPVFAD